MESPAINVLPWVFFFQAEDGIRDATVTGVQTCALPIFLVVEDDRKVAGFIEQGLREEGYAVDLAPDGDEATMLAHVYEYDLLVLDVMLPKKTGLQIAAELRREGSKTPILMLTARDATEDVVRGLDAGADDYLAKPFKFE